MHRRAFSLLELAIVLGISGLMVGYMVDTARSIDRARNGDCIANTQSTLREIRGSVERFARSHDRLPLPAARNVGTDSPIFGRETSGANIDVAGGVSFGAVPFQALEISPSYAGDCYGNKFSYMVTTALTTNASSGGYLDSTIEGNIALKNAAGTTTNAKIAYAIISHGVDGLGAVKLNYSAVNAADGPPDTAHRWCSGATLKEKNCLATAATVTVADSNTGKDAAAAYFDDMVGTSINSRHRF